LKWILAWLWPALLLPLSAAGEEAAKQPFEMVRTLQTVQDRVAQGSVSANEFQKMYVAELNEQLRQLAPETWEDARNARAAVIFVLSGGDPRLLKDMLGRSTPPPVDDALLKAALAYGEGRVADASQLFEAIEVRSLEPGLAGLAALIKGTLLLKTDAKKAIALFDDARLLAPGTLIEESALRQEILLVAREGEMERFDQLSSQYARRFAKSIYASNFRRQFFTGVARQDFKGRSEWISRTESELKKLSPPERTEAYLSIAEQATLGGNVEIARYAAENAVLLTQGGSPDRERAKLYEGAALIVTDDFDKGLVVLKSVVGDKLSQSDREILKSALNLSTRVRQWPEAPSASQDPMPASVVKAQNSLAKLDNILAGSIQ
jgi:chemotaxis protein MotC